MTIPRHGRRLLSGARTGDQKDRHNAVLNPKMLASQWKPGESGNPSGRPHKAPFTVAIRELLAEDYKGHQRRFKGLTNARVLAIKMFELALAGDLAAAKEIADRVEGKVPQRQELGGPDGGAIPFMNVSPQENERRVAELLAKTTTGEDQ